MEPTLYMKALCCLSVLVMKSFMFVVMVLDLPEKYPFSKITICRHTDAMTVQSVHTEPASFLAEFQ